LAVEAPLGRQVTRGLVERLEEVEGRVGIS